jgi:hypothetical protein
MHPQIFQRGYGYGKPLSALSDDFAGHCCLSQAWQNEKAKNAQENFSHLF